MDQLRWISLGYGILGMVLFVSRFSEAITILSTGVPTFSGLGTLAICLGSVGMMFISAISLIKPESKIALGHAADFRAHLYVIWGASIFAIVDVIF